MTMITVKIAAQRASVHPSRIRNLCQSGRIKSSKFGPDWAVDGRSLDQWIRTRTNGRPPGKPALRTNRTSADAN